MNENELIRALVGDHEREYRSSASFKFAVDNLAAVLPSMIEGLLHGCLANDSHLNEATLAVMHDPVTLLGKMARDQEEATLAAMDAPPPRMIPTSDPALRGSPGYLWTGDGSHLLYGRPHNVKFRRLGP